MAKVSEPALTRLFLKSCGRYKRIRHRPKDRPIVEYYTLQSVLEEYSFQTGMTTFTVLDSVHRTKIIQERIPYWQKRGLYIFFFFAIFSTSEYRGNDVEKAEERMVESRRLHRQGHFLLCCQQMYGWLETQFDDEVLNI